MPATRPAKPRATRPGRPAKPVEACGLCKEPILPGDGRGVQQMLNGDAHADCARRFWDQMLAEIAAAADQGRHSLGFSERCCRCQTWVPVDPRAERPDGHKTYCPGCDPAAAPAV